MDYTTNQLAGLEERGRRLYDTFEKIIDYGEDVRIHVQHPTGERVLVEKLTTFDELNAWSQRREKVTDIRKMYESIT